VSTGGRGWSSLLQRYHIDTVVADKREQVVLIESLRGDPKWRIDYEDDQAVVASRVPRNQEPSTPASPTATKVARSAR
jgi:hypothetical protein